MRLRTAAEESKISRKEVCKTLKNIKMGKAPGMYGLCGEMQKYGNEAVVEWITWIGRLAWDGSRVIDDWKMCIIVLIYEGTGD